MTTNYIVVDTKEIIKKMLTKNEYRYALANGLKLHAGGFRTGVYSVQSAAGKEQLKAECEKRVKDIRRKIAQGNLDEWIKQDDACIRMEKKLANDKKAIDAQLMATHLWDTKNAINTYRTGNNVDGYTAVYSDRNGIDVKESYERYSSRCTYAKTSRYFILKIRKGWNVKKVGGLLTFWKGQYKRTGMACEWIEQGREISSFRTVKGFLVRGEHVEAKSLKEAVRINEEHRAMQLARLLSQRKKAQRRQEQAVNGTLMITFTDSIKSGNCRPGTQHFKQQYEEAVGHEVKSISISDLRKYGKAFGVEYYAERVISYVLVH